MQASSKPYVSFEDFLAAQEGSETKAEWLDGIVYAMVGGSIEHARLCTSVTGELRTALAGRCTVLSSDAMLYIRETNLATYPDGTVICGPVDIQRVVRNARVIGEAVTNPTVVIEVLSESTESYDRGEKFAHYMRVPTLQAYVLVSQRERRVEVFRRPEDGRGHWQHEVAGPGESVTLCDARIDVDGIYG